MENYKSILQEKFQKLNLKIPIYTYIKTETGWISKITLCNGFSFESEESQSKKKSDQISAKKALEYMEDNMHEFYTDESLFQVLNLSTWNGCMANKIWIVIDLENFGSEKDMQKLSQLQSKGFIISGYASNNYKNYDKIIKYIIKENIHIDCADIPQIADVKIVMDITKTLFYCDLDIIYIISNDKFAKAAVEVFNLDCKNKAYPYNPRFYCVNSINQLLMSLSST